MTSTSMTQAARVARGSRRRMIPRHFLGLRGREYLPYLTSRIRRRKYDALSLERVWETLLPDRRLIPAPTGRHALWYFLDSARYAEGDEVLVAAYNYYVVIRVLVQKGLRPVFVDICPETLCMDPEDLARKITPRSRLVVVTHMFGHPADLSAISRVCAENGLQLFEDCAHAVGSLHDGKQVGRAGEGALFSFGIWKILSSGTGGMLALPSTAHDAPPRHGGSPLEGEIDLAAHLLVAALMHPRWYGWLVHPLIRLAVLLARVRLPALRNLIAPSKDDSSYRFHVDDRAAFHPFMIEMQRMQLERLGAGIERRRQIVRQLKERLAHVAGVGLCDEDRHGTANGSYLGIYTPDPEGLARHLERHGIVANPHEFFDCASLAQFAEFRASCPHAQYASTHLLRLPSFPELTDDDVERMASLIEDYVSRNSSERERGTHG